ncbi:flagellar biosynthetic protein FliO [Marinomonas algarum]|uniref:Flagellar protein n=1 Tax=Marinomonas algarum TaxID=2883105 RepID=A0A9X1IMJ9_9GAMM|nr:flagellar biosynthetic protein FliO [Marinomonas algarum]MCB5161973.1 flagellar biosynthetic protein FliO [Marinomonas algarum]
MNISTCVRFTVAFFWGLFALLNATEGFTATAEDLSVTSSLWKVTASLVFVIAFIPACLWLVKRFQLTQMRLGQSAIKVVQVQSLGAKEKIMLVEVEGERLLIGVTANGITHIKDLPKHPSTFAKELDDATPARADGEGEE